MPPVLFQADYGGVQFWIASLDGKAGRDVVVHSPSRGDVHVLQDRGRRHRTTDCDLLFVDEPGKASPEVRFLAFQDLAEDGDAHLLTHPLHGSYLARVTDFRYTTGADDRLITVSCTFLAEGEVQPVQPQGAGAAPLAGLEEVTATVARVEEELAAEGLSSPAPADTLAKVTAWTQAETPDTRAVYLEVASAAQLIDEEIDRLELVTNLDRWPLYREMINLRYQTTRAAESVTSEASDLIEVAVSTAIPLRLLCVDLYGPDEAEDMARQVAQINRLRTPGLVPAGQVLKVPRHGA